MKIHFTILFAALTLLFLSCEEIGPDVFGGGGGGNVDTTLQKVVLLEEFTAVRCPNCPDGDAIGKQLEADNPGRIEIVKIHTGILATPYTFSNYDFEIQEGLDIDQMLGPVQFQPSAAIDRMLFSGENFILLDRAEWPYYVGQQLLLTAPVDISLIKTYNEISRQLDLTANVKFISPISSATNIHVMITESNIVDAQLNDAVIDTFYVHDHVLRGMLTASSGDALLSSASENEEVDRSYSFTLPADWNATECRIVVFVSLTGGSFDVLQAAGANILE
jgi:hypothetical protein